MLLKIVMSNFKSLSKIICGSKIIDINGITKPILNSSKKTIIIERKVNVQKLIFCLVFNSL